MPKMEYKRTCIFCLREVVIVASTEGMQKWASGVHIQNALPELSADDREILISGSCGKCFDESTIEGEPE